MSPQLFDPSFADVNLTPRRQSFVDKLCGSIPALAGLTAALKAQVDAYRVDVHCTGRPSVAPLRIGQQAGS